MEQARRERNQEQILRIRSALEGAKPALILTHDHPDPDAIASARGLQYLLQRAYGVRCQVAYGGLIGRAENRMMIRLLRMELTPISKLDLSHFGAIALVDTQPGTGNNSLPPGRDPAVVLDHHPPRKASRSVPVRDLRTEYGATSTIITEYLQTLELPIGKQVATALFYGIRTDTMGLSRSNIPADVEAVQFLFPHLSLKALARIEHPPLSVGYFRLLQDALDRVVIHRDLLVVDLGSVEHPDQLAELAEAFLRMEGIRWTLVVGTLDERTLFSLRTSRRRQRAGVLARRLAGRTGTGGGHQQAAAGRTATHPHGEGTKIRQRVIRRFLEILGQGESPGRCLQDVAP